MNLLQVSRNIHAIRIARGLTIEQLALKSGFSKGFISQVENFRTTPSLKALNKIAEVLTVPVSDLFMNETASPEYSFSRLDRGEEIIRNDNQLYGMEYRALAFQQMERKLDPFIIEYRPANQSRGMLMHDSEEFFTLLEGKLDFYVISETEPHRMQQGDTLYMKANLPHKAVLADGCVYAKAIVIYSSSGDSGPQQNKRD